MSDSTTVAERDVRSLLHPATHLAKHHAGGPSLVVERGEGVYVWDEDGKQYLEALSGLWCTALGYGVEELADAAAEQMRKLAFSHLFAGKSHEVAVALAEKLKELANANVPSLEASKVFFGTSGSDANDSQIKLIWYYNNAIGRPEKKKIISRLRAYHGVTIASGSLTGLPGNHKDFDLPLDFVRHTDCPHYYRGAEPGESEEEFATRLADNLDELIQRERPETVAAMIAEPVLGAGGVVVPPPTYYEKVRAVLDRYDVLLIDDEVICGFGRTGNVFGAQTTGMAPDTMSVAKALSSAYLPISALLIPERLFEPLLESSRRLGSFGHGFTYTGHPVCAAVALKNLELLEQRGVYEHAARVGEYFQSQLSRFAEHPLVGEVRGRGLLAACELVKNKASKEPFDLGDGVGELCQQRCQQHGLIIRALGNSIAFCPPLIITESQIDELLERFERGLEDTLGDQQTRRAS